MIPIVSQIYAAAAAQLGDDTQAVWTNAVLQAHYVIAYSELFRALEMAQSPRIRREAYYNLPANTGYLDPVTVGLTNVGQIEAIDERGGITTVAITGALPATPAAGQAQITVTAHPFHTGQQITVSGVAGVSDDINDIWSITASDANHVLLNGCTCSGTFSGAGGVASASGEQFVPVSRDDNLFDVNVAPSGVLGRYAWEEDIIRFQPANVIRQVRISYTLSGNAPTATIASVGVDDSLTFLGLATAWRLARAKDRAIWTDLRDDANVALAGIIGTAVRNLFSTVTQRPRYREKRSHFGLY